MGSATLVGMSDGETESAARSGKPSEGRRGALKTEARRTDGCPMGLLSRRPLAAVAIAAAVICGTGAAGSAAAAPLTLGTCMSKLHIRCYSPTQVQRAYGLDRLHRLGIDGRGSRIAIVMNPVAGLRAGLAAQSKRFGLPRARLTIRRPAGPAGRPATGGEAIEGTLDTQAAHLVAPRAHLLYLAVPSPSLDAAVLESRPLAKAVDAAIRARADVISMSFGGVEQRYPAFRAAIRRAARAGIPVVAGSGDDGVVFPGSPGKTPSYPATDPNVTAVGGTLLTLDAAGRRELPDVAWGPDAAGGASGGGVSRLDPRPAWQRGVPGVRGTKRNYPDVSMLAATSGPLLVAFSPASKISDPLAPIGGTSVATPLFAGVLALTRQVAGRRIGPVNPALYRLARTNAAGSGIVDVVLGNNSSSAGGKQVQGYLAKRGFDLVTGLGTIDAPRFVPALAAATG